MNRDGLALHLDLFWEPALGDLVMVRPCARCGVRAFDEYPLKVTKRSLVQDTPVFDCQTTGPVTTRLSSTGRQLTSHPCWTGYYTAEQILPHGDHP
jgi:hypothetical protein